LKATIFKITEVFSFRLRRKNNPDVQKSDGIKKSGASEIKNPNPKTRTKETQNMKSKAGRISVKNRQELVAPVTALATSLNQPVNFVMAAVLWKGERLENRMSFKAVSGVVSAETVTEYQAEVARRAAARRVQIAGMVKAALPLDQRTPENISRITAALGEAAGLSVSAVQAAIRERIGTATSAEAAS
jgi:hypothetical protein